MINILNARVIKIIGTKFPHLRNMIRNHPYSKVVGMGVVKCLIEDMHMPQEKITDALLEEMIDKGIALYHENEEEIKKIPVLEHKRRVLCDHLRQIATEYIQANAS
ncbi:hypothetical protein [Hydrogenimonas sp.]